MDISKVQSIQKASESCHCPHCKSSNTKKIGFHGVPTKYLQQYLNWFAIKRQIENANVPLKLLITTICASYQTINVLKKIPLLEYR
jgi:hypothetical protein